MDLKSENSPRTSDSIPFFLKKIASKGQGPRLQKEAEEAVKILQEILPRFATGSETVIKVSKPKEGARHSLVAQSKEVTAKKSIAEVKAPKGREVVDASSGLSWERTVCTHDQKVLPFLGAYETFLTEGPEDYRAITSKSSGAFLTYLTKERQVTASSQNQAFNALLFLFRKFLGSSLNLKGSSE